MACRLGTHTNNLVRRRLASQALHSPTSSGATTIAAPSQPCPIRQLSFSSTSLAALSSSMAQRPSRALLAPSMVLRCPSDSYRETFHAMTSCHENKNDRPCYRCFHSSSVHCSESDEKQALKEESPAAEAAPAVSLANETSSREYSTPELTKDAAKHKAGLTDETRPDFQNPLHHNNEDMEKIFPEDFDSPEEFQKAISPVFPFDAPDGKVTAPGYLHELADEIVHLTMLEMNELVNKIADHYGFHEGMLSPDGTDGDDAGDEEDDGAGEAGEAAVAEKRTAFDVKLVGFDAAAKIKIIKEVRTLIPGLGLKEAKELVEGAPKVIQKAINMELAEEIKAKLEELGATIEIV